MEQEFLKLYKCGCQLYSFEDLRDLGRERCDRHTKLNNGERYG